MIKVISPSLPQTVKCSNCKAVLEYTSEDCHFYKKPDYVCQVTDVTKYIFCPCCGAKIILQQRYYDWG